LFCQKPIVRPPVFAGPQASTDAPAVCPVSFIAAVFGYVAQPVVGTVMVRVYVFDPEAGLAGGSVPVSVKSVVAVPPLKASVIVTFWFTLDVGVVKLALAVPVDEPSGVDAAVLSQVAVAVFVPVYEVGPDEGYVQT
jgi:hypothetical protein